MDEFLKSITCSGADCLSWILVLFNILAIFYLVFCSFWKVTRTAKITGWVWSAALLCATVGILIAHTCVYTLLTTIFTVMMIMAIMSIILPQPNATETEEKEEKSEKLGAYVISKTDDERYAFAIYDNTKKFIVKSKYSYATLEIAKKAICVCRDNGMMAAINDKTGAWIREEFYPTFEMFAKDAKYHFCLKINGKYMIFESEGYDDIKACEKMLEMAKKMVASTLLYLNTETANGKDYECYNEESVAVKEEVSNTGVIKESIIEKIPTDEIAVIQEVAATATEESVEETVIDEGEEEPIVESLEAVEEVVKESELITDVSEDGTTSGVIFTADRKTLWDKYAELTKEQRHYFDRIRDYANDKANIKCIEAKDYLTFKLLKDKLVRLRIRRDMVEAVFMLVGSSFKNTFSENDVKIREAATIIRVENEAYLEVALKTLDMQYDALVEERRLHKEAQKAKRREARRVAKESIIE